MAVRFATGLVGSTDVAEDLFQEVARAIHERAVAGTLELDSAAHLRNYLFRSLRNLAIDARAGVRRGGITTAGGVELGEMAEVAAPGPTPFELVAAREPDRRSEAAHAAIRELDPEDRELIAMRFGAGRTLREISERTGHPISTLHSRLAAAIEKIRRKLGKSGRLR